MSQDHPRHVDLTVREGAPGNVADVLPHLESISPAECRWPAGSCRREAENRCRARGLSALLGELRALVGQKKVRRSSSPAPD